MNIRLTAMNNETLLTVTNEIGPQVCKNDDGTLYVINGTYLGHCVIDNICVVFSVKNETSYITKIELVTPYTRQTPP